MSQKICIVSSCGGHLTEVRCLIPAYRDHAHFYVLNDQAILPPDMEGKTWFIAHSERDWKFLLNLWEAFRILWKERPAVMLVPDGVVILERGAGNTWEEAVNTLALLKQRGWKRVIVVSDPPHMRRLHWVWSKVFAGSDKEFVLVHSAPEWWNPARWWAHNQSGPFVVMEYIKLAYYSVKY